MDADSEGDIILTSCDVISSYCGPQRGKFGPNICPEYPGLNELYRITFRCYNVHCTCVREMLIF